VLGACPPWPEESAGGWGQRWGAGSPGDCPDVAPACSDGEPGVPPDDGWPLDEGWPPADGCSPDDGCPLDDDGLPEDPDGDGVPGGCDDGGCDDGGCDEGGVTVVVAQPPVASAASVTSPSHPTAYRLIR